MVTRTITNSGDPLVDAAGNIRAGARVTFTLLKDGFDTETGEYIYALPVVVQTDAAGIFSVALWPTDRGPESNAYLCQIDSGRTFQKPLPTGAAIQWKDFCEV
jgi:hypothetical protein